MLINRHLEEMTHSSALLLITGVVLLLASMWPIIVVAQLNEVPPCLNEVAAACAQNALKSMKPSACNWYIIMPTLSACVSEATSGCSTRQIIDWLETVAQFNATLNRADCSPTCPNPDNSKTLMDNCYVFSYTINGRQYTNLEAIVNDIFQFPSSSNPLCRLLDEIVSCLTNATLGCTGLMAVTENRLSSLYVDNATTVCDMKMFVGPTTSAPLAIFNAITIPTTTTTAAVDGVAVIIGAGVEESQTATWVTLIVVGGIVCIAIIIIVGILLHRTITHRKKAKHLDLIDRKQENKDRNYSTISDVLSRHHVSLTGVPRTRGFRLP